MPIALSLAMCILMLAEMQRSPAVNHQNFCQNCGQKLRTGKEQWLELNTRAGTYHVDGVPSEDSQGGFAFGTACAKSVVRNGGYLTQPLKAK